MRIEPRIPTLSEYKRLRNLVGWWDTDPGATERALRNSLFSVVAIEDNAVVGFGRISGDGGLYFYIQDLIVAPEYQAKGIGTSLMNELMNYIEGNAEPGSCIAIMAAKGLEKFYTKFGFKTRDIDAPGMYQVT